MLAGRPPHLRIVVGSAHEQYINVLYEALAHNPDGLEPRIVFKEPTNVYVVLIKADEMVSAQNDRFMASVIEWLPKDQPDQRAFSARYVQDGTNLLLARLHRPGFRRDNESLCSARNLPSSLCQLLRQRENALRLPCRSGLASPHALRLKLSGASSCTLN